MSEVIPISHAPRERTLKEQGIDAFLAFQHGYDAVIDVLRRSAEAEDWETYGQDPEAYYADITRGVKLPIELRRSIVQTLSDFGLGQRAIAGALRVSKGTVQNDQRELGLTEPPAPAVADNSVHRSDDDPDDRETPDDHWQEWDRRFGGFTVDVAAEAHNAKTDRFFTRAENGLSRSWAGERVWCNPPFSDLEPWLAKAWREWETTDGIVMLLPANRCEQPWWQEHVEPHRDRGGSPLRVEFIPGRLRFASPGGEVGQNPPFGCCLLTWGLGGTEHA